MIKRDTEKIKVKIKTESYIVRGVIHTCKGGRLSDYITAHVNRFIPVTDAEVFMLDAKLGQETVKREVVFINVEKIEMIEYL